MSYVLPLCQDTYPPPRVSLAKTGPSWSDEDHGMGFGIGSGAAELCIRNRPVVYSNSYLAP